MGRGLRYGGPEIGGIDQRFRIGGLGARSVFPVAGQRVMDGIWYDLGGYPGKRGEELRCCG